MLRVAWRNISSHKLRLALTLLTIVLGIAFVTGTFVFTDSLRKAFDSLLDQKGPDITVTVRTELNVDRAQRINGQVPTLPESTAATVEKVPGVQAAYPSVLLDGVLVLGEDGKPIGQQGPPTFGQSWPQDPTMTDLVITQGVKPSGPGEIVMLERTAEQANKKVGDKVRIDTPGKGTVEMTVVGLASRGVSGNVGGTFVSFSLPVAQELLVKPGLVSQIDVKLLPGQDARRVGDAIQAELGGKVRATTKKEATDELAKQLNEAFKFFNTFLLVFGLIALFVATFLIFNTFSMLVAQRSRELALLRAVGATKRQVRLSVLLEAILLGVIASTIGLVAGIGVSQLLRLLFKVFGAELPGGPLIVAPRTILVAYGIGVLVTVVSALLPARRASKVPPVAALQADASVPTASLIKLSIVGLLLVLAAIPTAMVGMTKTEDAEAAATWVGISAVLAIIGIIALSPIIGRGVVNVLGAPFRRSTVGNLAVENTKRNPRRTAATASALAIGLALMTAIGVIAASSRASVASVIDDTIGADYLVFGKNFQPFPHEVYESLVGTPGAEAVTYVRQIPARIKGDGTILTGVQLDKFPKVVKTDFTEGNLRGLTNFKVALDTQTALEQGIKVGDTLQAEFLTGKHDLIVEGLYKRSGFFQGYVASVETLKAIGDLDRDSAIYVRADDGIGTSNQDALRAELDKRLTPFPAVQLQDQSQVKAEITDQFNSLFGFIYALLALAVIVAFLGIVNTLSLSVFERTREIGLLRAVGSTRKQVRRMVMIESVLIAFFGAALGVAIGLVYGALLQKVLEPQGITELSIPWTQVVLFLVLGAVGGVLAAVLPSRRASKLNTLEAIAAA